MQGLMLELLIRELLMLLLGCEQLLLLGQLILTALFWGIVLLRSLWSCLRCRWWWWRNCWCANGGSWSEFCYW